MQFKRAIAATVALCAPAVPAVALATAAHDNHPTKDPVASEAQVRHIALHRRAAERNVRLARIEASRLGKALTASYGTTASARSLEDLQHSNARLRLSLDRLRRELTLVAQLRPKLRTIANCESHQDPDAVNATGTYRGMFQFDMTAWRAAGGHGDPVDASVREQYLRAAITFARRGAAPWPVCGRLV